MSELRTEEKAERGLDDASVEARIRLGQVNTVAERTSRTVGDIVRANVFTRFNAILGALLAVILVVGPLQDALFGVVLVANTVMGIVQGGSSSRWTCLAPRWRSWRSRWPQRPTWRSKQVGAWSAGCVINTIDEADLAAPARRP